MALQVALEQQQSNCNQLVQQLAAHVTQHHYKQHGGFTGNSNKRSQDHLDSDPNHQTWMTTQPNHPSDTKVVDRRVYSWCSKCRQGKGLWVSHHNTSTHVDGYCNQHRCQNGPYCQATEARLQQYTNHHTPPPPSAQMPILNYLDSYLPPTESDSQNEHEDLND